MEIQRVNIGGRHFKSSPRQEKSKRTQNVQDNDVEEAKPINIADELHEDFTIKANLRVHYVIKRKANNETAWANTAEKPNEECGKITAEDGATAVKTADMPHENSGSNASPSHSSRITEVNDDNDELDLNDISLPPAVNTAIKPQEDNELTSDLSYPSIKEIYLVKEVPAVNTEGKPHEDQETTSDSSYSSIKEISHVKDRILIVFKVPETSARKVNLSYDDDISGVSAVNTARKPHENQGPTSDSSYSSIDQIYDVGRATAVKTADMPHENSGSNASPSHSSRIIEVNDDSDKLDFKDISLPPAVNTAIKLQEDNELTSDSSNSSIEEISHVKGVPAVNTAEKPHEDQEPTSDSSYSSIGEMYDVDRVLGINPEGKPYEDHEHFYESSDSSLEEISDDNGDTADSVVIPNRDVSTKIDPSHSDGITEINDDYGGPAINADSITNKLFGNHLSPKAQEIRDYYYRLFGTPLVNTADEPNKDYSINAGLSHSPIVTDDNGATPNDDLEIIADLSQSNRITEKNVEDPRVIPYEEYEIDTCISDTHRIIETHDNDGITAVYIVDAPTGDHGTNPSLSHSPSFVEISDDDGATEVSPAEEPNNSVEFIASSSHSDCTTENIDDDEGAAVNIVNIPITNVGRYADPSPSNGITTIIDDYDASASKPSFPFNTLFDFIRTPEVNSTEKHYDDYGIDADWDYNWDYTSDDDYDDDDDDDDKLYIDETSEATEDNTVNIPNTDVESDASPSDSNRNTEGNGNDDAAAIFRRSIMDYIVREVNTAEEPNEDYVDLSPSPPIGRIPDEDEALVINSAKITNEDRESNAGPSHSPPILVPVIGEAAGVNTVNIPNTDVEINDSPNDSDRNTERNELDEAEAFPKSWDELLGDDMYPNLSQSIIDYLEAPNAAELHENRTTAVNTADKPYKLRRFVIKRSRSTSNYINQSAVNTEEKPREDHEVIAGPSVSHPTGKIADEYDELCFGDLLEAKEVNPVDKANTEVGIKSALSQSNRNTIRKFSEDSAVKTADKSHTLHKTGSSPGPSTFYGIGGIINNVFAPLELNTADTSSEDYFVLSPYPNLVEVTADDALSKLSTISSEEDNSSLDPYRPSREVTDDDRVTAAGTGNKPNKSLFELRFEHIIKNKKYRKNKKRPTKKVIFNC